MFPFVALSSAVQYEARRASRGESSEREVDQVNWWSGKFIGLFSTFLFNGFSFLFKSSFDVDVKHRKSISEQKELALERERKALEKCQPAELNRLQSAGMSIAAGNSISPTSQDELDMKESPAASKSDVSFKITNLQREDSVTFSIKILISLN